jgi:predicted AAA+ superfamily ATPase
MKFSSNNGWLLENLVFNTLNKRGNVFYYKNKKECDFILEIDSQLTEAVQVCYSLTDENKTREYEGLLAAMQEFSVPKGYIITNSQEETIEYKGNSIELVPAWKWILR